MALRTRGEQPSLWESILPEVALTLPAELGRVDALLDDPVFFAPFVAHFDPVMGRPSIPIETYLRLMFLKFRYGLGYESLCREMADSISWQRFARIPLGGRVPHPTTLMKITSRCGDEAVAQLNEALLAKAAGEKLLRMHKLRADTTVVEADVKRPTDSGLLAAAVGKIAKSVKRIKAAGGAGRTKTRDRRRSAGRRARSLAAQLRRRSGDAKDAVARITGELADIAGAAARDADAVVRNARRTLRRAGSDASGRLRRLVDDLDVTVARTRRVISQTRSRFNGDMPEGASRLISLHDPDARPIRKGRLGKPVEFGYKAQVVDNPDGIIVDHNVEVGAPPDAPMLAPAVARAIKRTGKTPRAVTADRGYGYRNVEDNLHELGVRKVVIPRNGKPGADRRAHEHQRPFRRMVKWRTGSEGRISSLKRTYGWDRTRLDGINGARIWCGYGVLAHNLAKIGAMR